MGYQKLTITGNVGRDAELRDVGGTDVCNFSVAVSKRFKSRDGEPREQTTWFWCAIWGARAASLAPHIKRGSSVTVDGEVSARAYTKDGEAQASLELRVGEFSFAGSKADGGSSGSSTGGASGGGGYSDADYGGGDDNIPF